MMTKTPDTLDRTVTPTAQYRSGVAARLAGLPVETLRVWERRYGNSDTGRSEHRQRLYSQAQVRRLRLIKQLVDQGHPIGALAQLPLEQLGALAVVPVPRSAAQLPRVALVGPALARRLAGSGRDTLALDISFERYTTQCAVRCADDALLHEQLNHAVGSARVLLEAALERLARAEGLPLPAGI